jgi:hypothetical protein
MSRFDDNDARAVQGTVVRYGSCISRPRVSCPVKAVGRIEKVALSDDDARALRRFQRLLVMLVLLLLATHGRDIAWPFVIWPMYARGYPSPLSRVSETELRLVRRDGEVTHLLPSRLLTRAESGLAHRVTAQAFVKQPEAEQYRAVLLRMLGPLLTDLDVVEIQGWTLSWTTDPLAVPPFDLAAPDEEILVGKIRIRDDRSSAQGTLRGR